MNPSTARPVAEHITTTAIVGAGALGCCVGARLALAGQRVLMIGRAGVVQVLQREGLRLHSGGVVQQVQVEAHTDMQALQRADQVLLCVKASDTETTVQQMAPWLRPDAMVLSLQNGVGHVELLTRLLMSQPVAVALAYVAAAMAEPGVVQHAGGNRLVMGWVRAPAAATGTDPLLRFQSQLVAAGFQAQLSDTPLVALWNKLIVNCACNAISAVAQAPYAAMAALPEVRELQQALVREAVAVAQAEGHAVSLSELLAAVEAVALNMPQQLSSTAQDLARGRISEIDHLNGHIVRCGLRHGIPTPVNHTLWALVKLLQTRRTAA